MSISRDVALNVDSAFHDLQSTSEFICNVYAVKMNWLFYVTINDISVIYLYVTTHRCAGGLKEVDLRSGSQRHRYFVGFFNVPVLHRHGITLFIRWFRHIAPFSRLYDSLGIQRTYSRLKPPASSRGGGGGVMYMHTSILIHILFTRSSP